MANYLRYGDAVRLFVLLCCATHVSSQEVRRRMCVQFETCYYASPLCPLLFTYFRCTEFQDVKVNEPACGLSSVTGAASNYPMPRVFGGIDAEDRGFPWTVYLPGCGGSIIDNNTIVTAAHCVQSRANNPGRLMVGYGSVNRSRLVFIAARKIAIHPNFNSFNRDIACRRSLGEIVLTVDFAQCPDIINHMTSQCFDVISDMTHNEDNDIAVVTLSEELPLNEDTNLRSICLPEPALTYETGRDCIITGWGQREVGESVLPETLQKASVPLVSVDVCRQVYASNSQIFVSERQLCAGYFFTGGVDACTGDSGGPLMCADGDRWVLQGIVSTGEGCARPGFPGVYAYVPQHISWIRSQNE